jgi:glycosyltransferase involved in cell wall biosynthesis
MRIVIDMQGAQTESRFRGIGRYSQSFAQAIVRNRGEHEIFLALSGLFPDTIEPIRAAFDGLLPQENIRVWHVPGQVAEENPGNDARREVAELIREAFLASLLPDVIHISSLFEGYVDDAVTSIGRFDRVTPVSVSLYDLIPLLNPDYYLKSNPRYAQYYRRKVEHLARAAIHLAISEFSRQEGLAHLDVPASRIVNVATAIEPCFCPLRIDDATVTQLSQKFGMNRPFILYTGGADERKNLPRLIQAYAVLPAQLRAGYQLLLAGKMPEGNIAEFKHLAKSAGLKPDELCFTGYLTDEELIQLYNLCELFVFPSWHEGFGLPALEAMACGAPVIGANTSSLPEVIDLAVALFDPLDVKSIAAKMAHGLQDEAFRAVLRDHGLQQAQRFSWDESGKRAITAWESLPKSEAEAQQKPVFQLAERKPRLAFVSPLPPERTGIADYSSELLPALAAHYDIEVVVAQDRVDAPWVNRHCKVRNVSWFRAHAGEFDRVLYQVGNSPFHQHMLRLLREIPGTVVLHDFYMGGLMAWLEEHAGEKNAWTDALYASHGYTAVRERFINAEAAKRKYPVNLHILQHAQGLIVHSEYSRNLAQKWYGESFKAWKIIPHLRSAAGAFDKAAARKQLDIEENAFVICSFGFLDSTKLNHRLINAWLGSALAGDARCNLIFVGENHGGDYGSSLTQTIRSSGLGNRIRITGFASSEIFQQYLIAADMAVQLRTHSRGETSGTVLDCMNLALPLITNANGSMAELDSEAVWMLPDEFVDADLTDALEKLWRQPEKRQTLGARAREIILSSHAPVECAHRYAAAIEHFYRCAKTATPALISTITAQSSFVPSDAELRHLAVTISANQPLFRPAKRLFLDVTATCRNDLKTGIERVARALLLALLEAPIKSYRIEPVYLSDGGGKWHYRKASRYTLGLLACPQDALDDESIEPETGDVLLGLDLSGDMLVQAEQSGLFVNYRNKGIPVYFMVYDLLPIRMPETFPPGADESHAKWLEAISKFDGAICISKAVADDLASWQVEAGVDRKNRRPFLLGWSHLGADMANSAPSHGLTENAEYILLQLRSRPSFLMVGTVEPRKGYMQTIGAFTQLWREGVDVNLVIVGREGWQGLPDDMRRDIPQTIEQLRIHPELNKRLLWLNGISDEYLEKVYAASTCLIAASYGEGFGLPLIEAAQHKLPIFARDIPVFREVAGDAAFYFSGTQPEELASILKNWLTIHSAGSQPKPENMSWLTWKQSAERLMKIIYCDINKKKNT